MIKNFRFSELIKTNKDIPNTPDDMEIIRNLVTLGEYLQCVRDMYGSAINVNSGYRSAKVNEAVGGSKTSVHMKGLAADLNVKDFSRLIKVIKDTDFDQLIIYLRNDKVAWVHVGLTEKPRKQIIYKTVS